MEMAFKVSTKEIPAAQAEAAVSVEYAVCRRVLFCHGKTGGQTVTSVSLKNRVHFTRGVVQVQVLFILFHLRHVVKSCIKNEKPRNK
jgi:hypothetical protein